MSKKNYVTISLVLMVLLIATLYPMYFPGIFKEYLFEIVFTQHLVVAGFYFLFKNFVKRILGNDQLEMPFMILITLMGVRMGADIYFLYFPKVPIFQYTTILLVIISVAAKILMILRILGTASGTTGKQLRILMWTEVAEVIITFGVPLLTAVLANSNFFSAGYLIFSMNATSFVIVLSPFIAMLWIILENESKKLR